MTSDLFRSFLNANLLCEYILLLLEGIAILAEHVFDWFPLICVKMRIPTAKSCI